MKVVKDSVAGRPARKGWRVQVEVHALKDGAGHVHTWAELPAAVARNIQEISEAPEVEYVEVTNGVKILASFAPRDTDALANMLQGRCPALAAVLRERKDTKLLEELRSLLTPDQPEGE